MWTQLNLTQQLNCVCDTLAKQAVSSVIIESYNKGHTQILPREDVALLVWGDKITSDISGLLRFHASKAVARKYHIHQRKKGKWTQVQFEEVDWDHLHLALNSKADNYKIWRSKQTSGFCGTRVQVGLYSREEYPDERCPNCGTRETDVHLMRCPDEDRTRLLINTVEDLEKWMETGGKTDPEIIYWVPKYLLMRDDKPFSQLGYMSEKMRVLAESQDKIGWQNFTEGYISAQFYNIQHFRLAATSTDRTGPSSSSPKFYNLCTLNGSTATFPYTTSNRDTYETKDQRTSSRKYWSFWNSAQTRYRKAVDSSSRSTLQS